MAPPLPCNVAVLPRQSSSMVLTTASAGTRIRLRVSRTRALAVRAMALREFLARRLAGAGPQESPASAA
eukprot:7967400-Lingulodinium_polyedra.AAC.1